MNGTSDPPNPDAARGLIRLILDRGRVFFSAHAKREMAADDLRVSDCRRVLRGGIVRSPDLVRGTWRYRVESRRMCFVIAFRSEFELVVVTAWRKD
jgi:hypothetical protein